MSKHPRFGHTSTGLAVHARTIDHHNASRFNRFVAMQLTRRVFSMACFWVFVALALLSLPATLHEAGAVGAHWLGIPSFFMSFGFIFLDAWVCQNFIQLVLLPALGVGQNLQNAAADARSAKQFEDTEILVDRLDTHTQGGITTVLDAVQGVRSDFAAVMETLRSVLAAAPKPAETPSEAPKPATPKRGTRL